MPSEDKPKNQKSVSTTEPYSYSKPLLNKSIDRAKQLFEGGRLNYQYFPGETVAPRAPETLDAWAMTADRARNGSPLDTQAKDYFSSVARGDFVNREAPGFDAVLNAARDDVAANKIMGGRYGSEAHDAAIAQALGGLRYQNYQTERGYQDRAAALLPQLSQIDYQNIDRLAGVGAQRQGYLQDQINENINRFNFDQNSEANAVALAQSLAGGGLGATTTATQPVQSQGYNPFLQFAGTAIQTLPYFFG